MGDVYLDINGASRHSENKEDGKRFNETNTGAGFRYEWGDTKGISKFAMAGQYKNSIDKNTNYAGGGFLKRIAGNDNYNLSIGGVAGAATGYGDGVTPIAMPMISAGSNGARINLMYAPKTDINPETVMLNASIKLGSTKERSARIKEHMLKKDE